MSATLLDAWFDATVSMTIPTISAGENRKVVIVIAKAAGSGTASMVSSMTVGGVSATYEGGFPASSPYNRCTVGIFTLNEAQISALSGSSISTTGGSGSGTQVAVATIAGVNQSSSTSAFLHIDDSASKIGDISLPRTDESYTVHAVSRNVGFSIDLTNPEYQLEISSGGLRMAVGSSQDNADSSPIASYSSSGAGRSAQVIVNFPPSNPSGQSIVPSDTDTSLSDGKVHAIAFSGLSSAIPESVIVVHGVTSSVQSDFSLGAIAGGSAIAGFTATIGNLPYTSTSYPASSYSYVVSMDDDSELTLSGISISPAADRSFVTASNPVSDSFSIIPSWVEGGAVTGDQIDWPKVVGNIQPTVNADFTHRGDRIDKKIPWPDSIKFTINYWDSATSTRYPVELEVAYSEDGTGTVIGITVREITIREITARNITARDL